jgi:hypothetical protein
VRDIAAQIAQIQPDALPLQAFQCVRRVGDISKRPVQFDGDDGVSFWLYSGLNRSTGK